MQAARREGESCMCRMCCIAVRISVKHHLAMFLTCQYEKRVIGRAFSDEASVSKSTSSVQWVVVEETYWHLVLSHSAGKQNKTTRGRLARKHFSTGAHPAAETPFYIAAASVSARGDALCVWSHESSISSSYFPLELRRAISHESGLRKLHCSRLLRASCSLQAAARCCTQVLCASCSAQVL